MIDPGLIQHPSTNSTPQSNSALGSFYLNPHAMMTNGGGGGGGSDGLMLANGNLIEQQRNDSMTTPSATTTNSEIGNSQGRSSSGGGSGHKKRNKKRSSSSRITGSGTLNIDDYLSEMPIPNGTDPFGQLANGMRYMNLYGGGGGYTKGGPDLSDLLIERRGDRFGNGSPGSLGGDGYLGQNRSALGGGGAGGVGLPHPMMMMPGQQNLMTNYLTPSLMVKQASYNLNSDYSSLPPVINLSGGGGGGVQSGTEGIDSGLGGGVMMANLGKTDRRTRRHDKQRFGSDPGELSDNENVNSSLDRASEVRSKSSGKRGSSGKGNNDSGSTSSGTGGGASGGSSSSDSQHRDATRSSHMSEPTGRILGTLLEQINLLHETNSKICRNLHDTKVEIEALKHAPSWGLRHRRDSISGLSTHSQPVGYGFGTQSPAPASYHSGAYTPGMMTDVVREVREGARVREDAMLNRVKSMVDERTWQANELNYKLQREVEELKGQVQQLQKEKQETGHRLTELELEVKTMRIVFGTQLQSLGAANRINSMAVSPSLRPVVHNETGERQMESTPLSTRPMRNSLNIKYGVMNEHVNPIEVLAGNGGGVEAQDLELMEQLCVKYDVPNVLTTTTTNSNTNNNSGSSNSHNKTNHHQSIMMGNNVDAAKASASDHMVMQMEKDTFDLRRELQDAVAGKKQAEQRILSLEKQMNLLQETLTSRRSEPKLNNFSKSETVLTKFSQPANGAADAKGKLPHHHPTTNATTVQTLVVGSTTTSAAGATQSPPKGNGFLLTGPVTDL